MVSIGMRAIAATRTTARLNAHLVRLEGLLWPRLADEWSEDA